MEVASQRIHFFDAHEKQEGLGKIVPILP